MIRNTNEVDEAIWNTLAEEDRRRQSFSTLATPQVAERLGQIHNQYPSLPAGVKLSAAKANLPDEMVLEIAKRSAPIAGTKRTTPKKGLMDGLLSKLKTASRYTFAALNFPTDMVQGAAAQIFDKDNSTAGWFISTDLGSLIANDEEAGTGFFIGGRAKELQAERARRYRGEIDGSAFTIGRGLASAILEPNTMAYRLMSGAIDAGVAVGIPTAPGASQAGKAARIAEEAGIGGRPVAAIAELSRTVGRGSKEIAISKVNADEIAKLKEQAGIVGEAVDIEQANRFFTTGFGKRIIDRTAETNDFSEVWNLWGRKLDPGTVTRLAEADTPAKVQAELLNVLGTEITSTVGVQGGRRVYRSLAQRNATIQAMPFGEGISRAFAKMPRHHLDLFDADTPRDQIEQLETLDRTLKLFKTDPAKRQDFINRAGRAVAEKNETLINQLYDDMTEEFKQSMVRFGTDRRIVDAIYERYDEYVATTPMFMADELGNPTDMGLYRQIHGIGSDVDNWVFMGGNTTAELGRRTLFIPDPKQVRRLTNNFNWLWVKKDPNIDNLRAAGQLRLPLAVAEKFQEEIWRKYVTATIGNFVRNTVDSQISIGLSGKGQAASPFFHPFQYMAMVGKRRGQGDVLAQNWDEAVAGGFVDDAMMDYRRATGDMVSAYYKDPLAAQRRAQKLGQFKQEIRNTTGPVQMAVVRAHGDEIGRLNADWAVRSMAPGIDPDTGRIVGGLSVDEIMDLIKSGDPEAVKWFNTMRESYRTGRPIFNTATREMSSASIDLDVEQNLRYLLESQNKRLRSVTGNNEDLMTVVHFGYVPTSVEVNSKFVQGDIRVGGRVQYEEFATRKGGRRVVTNRQLGRVVDINERTGQLTIQPYAFDGAGNNTKALENYLARDEIYFNEAMVQRPVGEVIDLRQPEMQKLVKSMDQMVNKFHSFLYTQPISKLERAPLFKSLYYDWVDKMAVSLDEASLNRIIDNISTRAKGKPEEYLTPELWAKLQDLKANPSKLYGTINDKELSSFASGAAIDEYMRTVYNAVDRRNATDVLRFLSPFAQQQAEFLGRMARFAFVPVQGGELGYLPNANSLRKLQLIVEGGREVDPDGDGRGLFYKDPNTGQWSFQFPLTGELTKFVTGVKAPVAAPVRGVFLGLDYRPGLGPFGTIAASQILSDSPSLDMVKKFLLPYGERTDVTQALTPSWITKIYEGITGQTNGRFFANTYAETMQALAATGKYNLDDPNQRDQMLEDARNKAQVLAVLRGITQFTGPAAGDVDIMAPTKQGDVYAAGLAAAYQSLKNINYDTATLRFIEIFGDDAFSYLANKTISEVGGLEGSKEFGVFERENKGLFRQYKDVAGFFGPVGTDFDFQVYSRQLQTGARRRLSPEEMLKAAERSIGFAYYKDMKNYLGPVITKQERAYLSEYRRKIIEKYPGFGESQYDPNETPRKIAQLFEAAKREDLQGNPVAKALNYYETVRNNALAEAANRGYSTLKSDKVADLQAYVADYADALIEEYPEFARVYERVLAQELD